MSKSSSLISNHSTAGDTAVSGLFSGLQGGVAMGVVIVVFSLLAGQGLGYLENFSAGTPVQPQLGLIMHLAVSCIYGILYSLVLHWTRAERLRLPGWLLGLIYALILWVLAVTMLLPAAHSLLLTLVWPVFFCGHVAYGLVLGARRQL